MSSGLFINKICRCWKKLRLKPIRVFCFHQVSDVFDPDAMNEVDWIQTRVFKQRLLALKMRYVFVSLEEAYRHIADDKFRMKRYAVLTADDGWESVKSILPWLDEQQVPVTLFLNPLYLDGNHFRERGNERYLSEKDVLSICSSYQNVSIGIHGWEHVDASEQSECDFRRNVEQSVLALNTYESFVSFFAFPWGRHNQMNDRVLQEYHAIPVLMDGLMNYDEFSEIHRELLTVNTD